MEASSARGAEKCPQKRGRKGSGIWGRKKKGPNVTPRKMCSPQEVPAVGKRKTKGVKNDALTPERNCVIENEGTPGHEKKEKAYSKVVPKPLLGKPQKKKGGGKARQI